jgi:hypothetical protein
MSFFTRKFRLVHACTRIFFLHQMPRSIVQNSIELTISQIKHMRANSAVVNSKPNSIYIHTPLSNQQQISIAFLWVVKHSCLITGIRSR